MNWQSLSAAHPSPAPLCLLPSGGRGERRTTAVFFTNHYRLYKPCWYFYKPWQCFKISATLYLFIVRVKATFERLSPTIKLYSPLPSQRVFAELNPSRQKKNEFLLHFARLFVTLPQICKHDGTILQYCGVDTHIVRKAHETINHSRHAARDIVFRGSEHPRAALAAKPRREGSGL